MFDGCLPAPAELPGIPDAGLIDAVVGWTRAAAAAQARAMAVIAELHHRRLTDPVHPDWVCDDTDAAAAELSAALTIGHGRALRLFDVAVLLRDHLPETAALFAAGQVGQSVIDTIYDRTYLVQDPQAWAALDAKLAAAVTRFGAMTTYTLTRKLDEIVDRVDPGAVRRTRGHVRNRDFVVGEPDEKSGTTAVYGRLSHADAALFERRLEVMARSVCPDDPRTLGQRRADAGGALGAGSFHLACRCDNPDCAAKVDDGRASSIIIHVLAEGTATDATADPLLHGDPDDTDEPDEDIDDEDAEEQPADGPESGDSAEQQPEPSWVWWSS